MSRWTQGIPSSPAGWTGWAVRTVISVLFLYAGWIKILDPEAFARSIQGYRLVSDGLTGILAWTLPWLELWCALALWVTPPFRRAAWLWILAMLVVFTVAKISAVSRGLDISCGCTGSGSPMDWGDVALNVLWTALAATGLLVDRRWPSGS